VASSLKKTAVGLTSTTNLLGLAEEGIKQLAQNSFVRAAVKSIPVIGGVAGVALDMAHDVVDRVKDMATGAKLSGLSTSVGELEKGLENAKTEIESKSQELTKQMDQMKSNLLDEIQRQEEKITQLQAETKQQLVEEQKKLLEEAIRQLTTAQENINRASHEQVKNAEAKFTEFKNELDQVKGEQKEIHGELQKQADMLRWHEQRLNSFAQEMADIKQEVSRRFNQLEGKTEQALQLTQKTSERVNNLAREMEKTQDKVNELEKQMRQTQHDIQKAREEVQQTNEKLDNFIKRQELLDFSAHQLVFDRIQKTLSNKAEEAKLLATLNLLEETKNLLPEEINLATGAEESDQPVIPLLQTLIAALEGQESVRMPSEHKAWEDHQREEYRQSEIDTEPTAATSEAKEASTNLEKLEAMKKEVLERLQEVQQTIKKDLKALEKRKESEPTHQQEKIHRQYQINKSQRKIAELEEQAAKEPAKKQRIARELAQKKEELATLQKQQEFIEQLAEQEQKILQAKKEELSQQ
jgi:outer membrane murein-binding lipoprotein Lpp